MSNQSNLLDLPNEIHTQGLLFSPVSSDEGLIQEMQPSDIVRISPSGQEGVPNHNHAGSYLPGWNFKDRNQWPYRLFTAAPPTPSGTSLPLASFRVPWGQQELEELQNPSQQPSTDPLSAILSQLSQINAQIYTNCRGNQPGLWLDIAEEIYNLQVTYGELITPAPEAESGPKYKCTICLHPSTNNPTHLMPKRRWDCSPDILSHGHRDIKPWFSDCGKGFPRDRERRRHSQRCKTCIKLQEESLVSSTLALHSAFSPIPPFPLENTTPQEPVIPSSPTNSGRRDRRPARTYPQDSTVLGGTGPQRTNYIHISGAWAPHSPYSLNGWPQRHVEPYAPSVGVNEHSQSTYPLGIAMSHLSLHSPGVNMDISLPNESSVGPILPQYNDPGFGHAKQYDQVCFRVPLLEPPSLEKSEKDVAAWRVPMNRSHFYTVAIMIFLGMSALVWFFIRWFLYP